MNESSVIWGKNQGLIRYCSSGQLSSLSILTPSIFKCPVFTLEGQAVEGKIILKGNSCWWREKDAIVLMKKSCNDNSQWLFLRKVTGAEEKAQSRKYALCTSWRT